MLFGVQPHHSLPALHRLFDLVVGIEASDHFERRRLLFEDALHGVIAGPPAETDVADSGYLLELLPVVGGLDARKSCARSWTRPRVGRS